MRIIPAHRRHYCSLNGRWKTKSLEYNWQRGCIATQKLHLGAGGTWSLRTSAFTHFDLWSNVGHCWSITWDTNDDLASPISTKRLSCNCKPLKCTWGVQRLTSHYLKLYILFLAINRTSMRRVISWLLLTIQTINTPMKIYPCHIKCPIARTLLMVKNAWQNNSMTAVIALKYQKLPWNRHHNEIINWLLNAENTNVFIGETFTGTCSIKR